MKNSAIWCVLFSLPTACWGAEEPRPGDSPPQQVKTDVTLPDRLPKPLSAVQRKQLMVLERAGFEPTFRDMVPSIDEEVVWIRLSCTSECGRELAKIRELTVPFDKVGLILNGLEVRGLTDAALASLEGFANLDSLEAYEAPALSSIALAYIAKAPRLRRLTLRGAKLTDESLKPLAAKKSLQTLHVYSQNSFSPNALFLLRGLTDLRELGIGPSTIRDGDLKLLSVFPHLHILSLEDSQVSYEGLLQLDRAKEVTDVRLSVPIVRQDTFERMRKIWPKFEGGDLGGPWTCSVHDGGTGQQRMIVRGMPTFSADGKSAALTHLWRSLEVIDWPTGSRLWRIDEIADHGCIGLSDGGRRVALRGLGGLVLVRERSVKKPIFERKFSTSENSSAMALSPDGKLLAVAEANRVVSIWDVAAKKEIHRLADDKWDITRLAFSPDGTKLATKTQYEGRFTLWSTRDWKQTLSLRGGGEFRFSSDRKSVLWWDEGSVCRYDIGTGRLTEKREGNWKLWKVISPDGRLLAMSAGNEVRICEVGTNHERPWFNALSLPNSCVHLVSVDFTPDSKMVAAFWEFPSMGINLLRDDRLPREQP